MKNKADVLILAGGFGTRMSSSFPGIPKPLIPVSGIPILERQIEECRRNGFTNICLLLHHQAEQIINYFKDGSDYGVNLIYEKEKKPLGTGGALLSVLDVLSSTFVVLYADIFSDIDLKNLVLFHKENNAEVTVVAHPNSHPYDSDILILDNKNRVKRISPHPHDTNYKLRNMVNAAMYVIDKNCLLDNKLREKKMDIAQNLLPSLISEGKQVLAYVTLEYLKDMGTPERLIKVETDIKNGIPKSRRLNQKRKSIFFDRDGTLNVEVGHLSSVDDFELEESASDAVAAINQSNFIAICTTNQPVIARGDLSEEEHFNIKCKLDIELGKGGAYLDAYYFCPHHPDSGFDGEIPNLKKVCECRKPAPGMFIQASKDHNIDLSMSWVIGDRTADLQAAQNIGARSILVATGSSGKDKQYLARETFNALNVKHACKIILNDAPNIDNFMYQHFSDLKSYTVIAISGLARTGKSILASNLQWYLRKNGFSAHIMDLDIFLKPDRNEDMHPIKRYDLESASKIIKLFTSRKIDQFHEQGFDHNENLVISYGYETVGKKPILIVDGMFSYKLLSTIKENHIGVYVECDEYIRKKRFEEKYFTRGLSSTKIDLLWQLRSKKEDLEISNYRQKANYVYNMHLKEESKK